MGKKRQALNQSLSPSHSPKKSPEMEATLQDINAKFEFLCGQFKKIEDIDQTVKSLDSTVKSLDSTVKSLVTENASLREDIAKRDDKIRQLSDQLNRLDQASRATSLRILGLPVTTQTPLAKLHETVYNEILLPTLDAAKQNGDITSILPPHFLIVNVFAIPSKKASESCPVILKLHSEVIRSLVFKYKKTALPTMTDISSNRVRNKYSIFEDLAPATHAAFRTFSDDIRVKSAWSYSGQIRFKTHESEVIYKVKSLTDSYDSLVKPPSSSPPSQSSTS
jgi:regulator of replication initiation timing